MPTKHFPCTFYGGFSLRKTFDPMSVPLSALTRPFVYFIKLITVGVLAVLGILLIGFGGFLLLLSSYPMSPETFDHLPSPDALVLVTGGPGRIQEGMRLLAHHKEKKLFISGVSPKVRQRDLLPFLNNSTTQGALQVVLGHKASNTHENALEIKQWIHQQSLNPQESPIRSLWVISSFYHLPRCLLELGAELGDISLIPYGVGPHIPVWRLALFDPYYRCRIVQEYIKCLVVLSRRVMNLGGR